MYVLNNNDSNNNNNHNTTTNNNNNNNNDNTNDNNYNDDDDDDDDDKHLPCTVRPNKKETRFISEIFSLPRKIETNCMLRHTSRAFSLLSFDTKHIMISQCMMKGNNLNSCMSNNDLRRIMVLSRYDQVQTR